MPSSREIIFLLQSASSERENLCAALESAGYSVSAFGASRELLEAVRQSGADLVLMDSDAEGGSVREVLTAVRGSAATEGLRVILLVGAGASERAAALDFGADDALSRPYQTNELLARARAQLRAKRATDELRQKTKIAEEGQQIAHTAFEALAVTEKMTHDAFSLDRWLKIGLGALFAVAVVMAAIFFLFSRSASKATQRANAVIARLEGGLTRQQDLLAQTRKLREEQAEASAAPEGKAVLQKHAADLKAKMAEASSDEVTTLQKELAATNARLRRVEQEGQSAASLIPKSVDSVCLLHVSVAFRSQQSGQRLRYAGLNPQGEPLKDSDGNPVLTTEGRGPEVRLDVFGTGFLAGPEGNILTNRHVAEPWWKNDDLGDLSSQGLQAEISLIRAYFPGDPRAFRAEIQNVSKDVDLATMRGYLLDLKRPVLATDVRNEAAVTGEPVVLMGYATGLAAILARTDEETAQQILAKSGGDVSAVLDDLARRNLIRPLITQGHIGDILPDKIVFDAQTTSGGSGGPLINQEGKVIGVTFAVLRGFGGSNFGIPIRFSQPLLGP